MSDTEARYVRLQVELVLEISDAGELSSAALDGIAGDDSMPDEERAQAEMAVRQDESEALAYLVDPFDLVTTVPGVELIQASWSCSHTEYDPESDEWDLYEDDETAAEEEPDEV